MLPWPGRTFEYKREKGYLSIPGYLTGLVFAALQFPGYTNPAGKFQFSDHPGTRSRPAIAPACFRLSKKSFGLFRQRVCVQDAHRLPAREVSFPRYTPPEMADWTLFPPCAAETLRGFLLLTWFFDKLKQPGDCAGPLLKLESLLLASSRDAHTAGAISPSGDTHPPGASGCHAASSGSGRNGGDQDISAVDLIGFAAFDVG